MSILLAILAGASLGYVLERGDFCFHSTLRGLVRKPKQLDLFRAYLLVLLIVTPLLYIMRSMGWIDAWVPPFVWQANVFGGVIFGVGMVVAASCVTGLFYKLGHGMLGTLVGLVTWAAGDMLVYLGPLAGLRERLSSSEILINAESATVLNAGGVFGWVVLVLLGITAVVWLLRSPGAARNTRGKLWGWLPLGIAVSMVLVLAWLLGQVGNVNYPYGTSYVPTSIYLALRGEQISPWIPAALLAIIPGAFLGALHGKTLWVRGESVRRYLALGAGGFLMGIGAAFAGGCNLGHSLVGVPLLSLGSVTTTLSMLLGVFLAHRVQQFWKK